MQRPPYVPREWVELHDETRQIDPIHRAHWINDSHDRHAQSLHRAQALHSDKVQEISEWHASTPMKQDTDADLQYTPSVSQLDLTKRWTETQSIQKWQWRGLSIVHDKEMPTITDLKYEGVLPNKSTDEINAEILASERSHADRVFDRSNDITSV